MSSEGRDPTVAKERGRDLKPMAKSKSFSTDSFHLNQSSSVSATFYFSSIIVFPKEPCFLMLCPK